MAKCISLIFFRYASRLALRTILGLINNAYDQFHFTDAESCIINNCNGQLFDPTYYAKTAVGPALDDVATRKDAAYILESLVNPNAKLAEGYTATPISPMPPMNLILKPQEFADVKAFIMSLK
jgi:Cytochrome c